MTEIEGVVGDLVANLKRSAGIDTRFVVLDFSTTKKGTIVQIEFTASSRYVAEAIHQFFEKHRLTLGSSVTYTVRLVEHNKNLKRSFAICNTSAAPLRGSASHGSEQISQFLIGETADVLEEKADEWSRIRLHLDGYVGWVAHNQIVTVDRKTYERWLSAKKATVLARSIALFAEPKRESFCVGELLQTTYLPLRKTRSGWRELELPDGSSGWAPSVSIAIPKKKSGAVTSAEIVHTAKEFLGISYVWGGRSTKGFDCSGFTQTVFRIHGVELPRDASLQWKCGTDIGNNLDALVEGDLMFFSSHDNRITHVGIALGEEGMIIHASGFVKISSLDPRHELYDKKLASTFLGARRLGKVV